MSDWYFSLTAIVPPRHFLLSWFMTRLAPASFAAFTASWNFAAGTSPLSVTTPPETSTVTPVTPYFERLASTLFLMAVSSEGAAGARVGGGGVWLGRGVGVVGG